MPIKMAGGAVSSRGKRAMIAVSKLGMSLPDVINHKRKWHGMSQLS
jgi:hypothetical protein